VRRPVGIALCLLLVATAAVGATPKPESLVLGLKDLPRGFERGDDTVCGTMGVEGYPERMAQIILAHRPRACLIQLENLRNGRYVESDALLFGTPQGAAEMYADRREFLEREISITKAAVRTQPGIGDEARLYVTSDAPALGVSRPGAVVIWRRGVVFGALLVAGPSRRASTRIARRLARKQDIRMRRALG
jgi:hypothetical protein